MLLFSASESQELLVQKHIAWYLLARGRSELSSNPLSTAGSKDHTLGQESITVLWESGENYIDQKCMS